MSTFAERAAMAFQMWRQHQPEGRGTIEQLALRYADITGRQAPTVATVSRWLSGDREPDLEAVAGLAAALGIPAALLAFGEAAPALQRAPVAPHRRAKLPEDYATESDAGKGPGRRRRGG